MDDDLFANIDQYAGNASAQKTQQPVRRRKPSAAAVRAGEKKRRTKPTPDRYRSTNTISNAFPIADIYEKETVEKRSKKSKKNKNKYQSVEAAMKEKRSVSKEKKPNIFKRIIFFFRTNSLTEIWMTFLNWLDTHRYAIIVGTLIFLVAGMMISRYISVAGALIFIAIGALASKEEYDTTGYFCYGAAFFDFIVPYIL